MLRFGTHHGDIERHGSDYLVAGGNDGDEPIRVGHVLNGLRVTAIEAYGRPITSARLG